MRAADGGLAAGASIAGYRINRQLSRGGMGVVYLATHQRLGRKAALKILSPELADDASFCERFVRESELTASLEHPNIIPIYDAGEHDGVLYIAMRYVEGLDLRQTLKRDGRLSLEQTIEIIEPLAAALDTAHSRGLIHRDVKPANILIEQATGRVYLTDFGVAKLSGATGFTRTGAFLGTVHYCAPEQIEGRTVDARTDIYSLGCVLYHCLAGQPPFPRDTEVAVIHAHLSASPPAVSSVRPDLPQFVDGVVATAMAKVPEARYSSGTELATALRQEQSTIGDSRVPTPVAPLVMEPQTVAKSSPPIHPPAPTAISGRRPFGQRHRLTLKFSGTAASLIPAARESKGTNDESTPPFLGGETPVTAGIINRLPTAAAVLSVEDARRRGRSASSTAFAVSLASIVVLTVGGFALGKTTPRAKTLLLTPVRTSDLSLSLPSGWRRANAPTIKYEMTLTRPLFVIDDGGTATLMIGWVKSGSASLIPSPASAAALTIDSKRPRAAHVAGATAYAYVGNDRNLVAFFLPTTQTILAAVCENRVREPGSLGECESIVASLRLRRARPVPVGPSVTYARKVGKALRDAAAVRDRQLRLIRVAQTQDAQARATRTIANAYRSSAIALVGAAESDTRLAPANARLVTSLREVAASYLAISVSASAGNANTYQRAVARVERAERMVVATVAALKPLGFRMTG